jgi:iron complex transport system ATP-binding protein
MIRIDTIVKAYGPTTVLHGVSLDIPAGGLTCLVGPNGAGKSTLLSIVARLLPADSGTVTVDGLDVTTTRGRLLATRLAVLRQENHFTARVTVRDLVGFGRFPHSHGRLTPADREHIDRAISFLDLGALEHRFLDELSGGQRQRAYVAMVLAQDTDYVLLDEPLNNLDISHAVAMMGQLRRAADELGKTIVMVVHDINFASAYADHIVAMSQGRIVHAGPPDAIMRADHLREVFDADVHIHRHEGRPYGLYYRPDHG